MGFANKRKMLKNNLAGGLKKSSVEIEEVLEKVGLDKKIRAQELSLGNWIALFKLL